MLAQLSNRANLAPNSESQVNPTDLWDPGKKEPPADLAGGCIVRRLLLAGPSVDCWLTEASL
jgi:hypothetical protein